MNIQFWFEHNTHAPIAAKKLAKVLEDAGMRVRNREKYYFDVECGSSSVSIQFKDKNAVRLTISPRGEADEVEVDLDVGEGEELVHLNVNSGSRGKHIT